MSTKPQKIGEAALSLRDGLGSQVFLICEHASNRIPHEYEYLGLRSAERSSHIAWDIGAAVVTRVISKALAAPAVLGATCRLVVDTNRRPDRPDVIPTVSHGIRVPGNENLDAAERESRFERFYTPFHEAVDRQLAASEATLLLSIHSYSQELDPENRNFDIGILFDEYESLGRAFANRLAGAGIDARLNVPYSGRSEVVSSAQTHGRRHKLAHFEIEINQRLLASESDSREFGRCLSPFVAWLGAEAAGYASRH